VTENEEAIQYEVKIHAASRQVLEVLPQVTAGSSAATIKGFSAPWISRAILSLAGQVEAVKPDQIKAAVHARAQAALENYH
jgi:predicted DNA-binding transcriptional regulator YafY